MRKPELVYALNAGAVDKDALSRVDLEKMRLAGEHPVTNLLPMVLGPAMLRPGTKSLLAFGGETVLIPFQRSIGTAYFLALSAGEMRIISSDAVQQVPSVSATVSTGSWSNASTSPATASGGATLTLTPTARQAAKLRQTITIGGGQTATTHIVRIVVTNGPVYFRVGSSSGLQDVLRDVKLDTGTHKISFVPGAGTVYFEVRAEGTTQRTVTTFNFESAILGGTGDLVIPTPWASIDLVRSLRYTQSIDVMFVGDGAQQQRRIVHRGPLSWGIEVYKTDDGPLKVGSTAVNLTPADRTGNTTITASDSFFESTHVGTILELTHTGKVVDDNLDGAGQTTDYITIVGVGATSRLITITGTSSAFTGTIVLERSFDAGEPTVWAPVNTYASIASITYSEPTDNTTAHLRLRVTAYTSGSNTVTLTSSGSSTVGRARITSFTSPTQVSVEVVKPFGTASATNNWRIGAWSNLDGWPRTPVLHDSRLHWFRKDQNYASYVDDYTNFDDTEAGDSATLTRSVGEGGEDGVLWGISDNRLIVGTASFEAAIAASELDEPLTPSAYTVRKIARRGCADVPAVTHDEGIFYVQRSNAKLYEIATENGKYKSTDVSRLNPSAYAVGITAHAVQQQPDMHHYAVLDDGTITVLTFERDDKVVAITTFEIAGGTVEDIGVLPNVEQDDVYVVVNRGGTRYLEKFANEADQRAVSTCALLDGHKVLTGSISSITGATHFASQTVQVWADGQRRADVTLNGSGVGSLGATYSRVVYGKKYTAAFKSVKLAYASQLGPSINQNKIVKGVGMVLAKSCVDGILVGRDASNTDPIPEIINGAERTTNQFFDHLDLDIFPINSSWDSDARVYFQIDSAEGPCTVQAITIDIETRDGTKAG